MMKRLIIFAVSFFTMYGGDAQTNELHSFMLTLFATLDSVGISPKDARTFEIDACVLFQKYGGGATMTGAFGTDSLLVSINESESTKKNSIFDKPPTKECIQTMEGDSDSLFYQVSKTDIRGFDITLTGTKVGQLITVIGDKDDIEVCFAVQKVRGKNIYQYACYIPTGLINNQSIVRKICNQLLWEYLVLLKLL